MKKRFNELTASDFPDIDVNKFNKWKAVGMNQFRRERLYIILSFVGMCTLFTLIGFMLNSPKIIRIGFLPALLCIYFGKSMAGKQFEFMSEELGISDELLKKALSGEIVSKKDIDAVSLASKVNKGKEPSITDFEKYSDKELIVEITPENRNDTLGKNPILHDETALDSKVFYKNGVPCFDNVLQSSAGKINFAIQFYKRKSALEIRMAKLFTHHSIGIKFDFINHVTISGQKYKTLSIILKNKNILQFFFHGKHEHDVLSFFKDTLKLKVVES